VAEDQGNANPPPADLAHVVMTADILAHPAPNYGLTLTRPGQVPAFTVEDVIAYFKTHPLIAGRPVIGTTVTLIGVQFMTREAAEAATQRTSLQGQVKPGGIVALVEFSGTFDVSHISHPPHVSTAGWYASRTQLIFDATTGKTLVWRLPGDAIYHV
jgi:hypothetical protein